MSFAKVAPEFDRMLEKFIHFELTKADPNVDVSKRAQIKLNLKIGTKSKIKACYELFGPLR